MKTLAEIIARQIEPIRKNRKKGEENVLGRTLTLNPAAKLPAQYEVRCFNFLVNNKVDLGISTVKRFKNRLVDGEILLSDQRLFVLEIKFRMGWLKECQAEWQFRQFLKRIGEQNAKRYHGAVVMFESFSGDWGRKAKKDTDHSYGWDAWYFAYHDKIDGKPMSLVMFSKDEKGIQHYPGATLGG
jgi:hypothetical protein